MTRYLLLIFLFSWSLLVTNSRQCNSGVALPKHALSVTQSLMANADVAVLKSYNATSLQHCMEECCSEKYGDCSVASFKNNSELNCIHFNCHPLKKCRFLSSNTTDSFSFSSSLLSTVPSLSTSIQHKNMVSSTPLPKEASNKNDGPKKHPTTTAIEHIATFSESEQFALKNDNTTIKPRKGVEDIMTTTEGTRSGIKPRKGVVMNVIPYSTFLFSNVTKSKVKPRKGVGPYISATVTSSRDPSYSQPKMGFDVIVTPTLDPDFFSTTDDIYLDEIFKDDPEVDTSSVEENLRAHTSSLLPSVTESHISPTKSVNKSVIPTTVSSDDLRSTIAPSFNSGRVMISKTPSLPPSDTFMTVANTDTPKPSTMFTSTIIKASSVTSSSSKSDDATLVAGQDTMLTFQNSKTDEESESDKKYRASMHLVLSLVFGLLVLFAVLGVVAKRVYDGWLRRHYHRMDFLIDGMYNGYD